MAAWTAMVLAGCLAGWLDCCLGCHGAGSDWFLKESGGSKWRQGVNFILLELRQMFLGSAEVCSCGLLRSVPRAFHRSLSFNLNQCLAPIAFDQGPEI